MASLRALLASLPAARLHGGDAIVRGVSADSRTLGQGDVFVAIRGVSEDGHRYIPEAMARGARAIVSEQRPPNETTIPWVTVADARAALGWLAAALHGFPSRRLGVIGVTGTDGKTTIAHLVASLLEAAGEPVGLVSTVQVRLGAETPPKETQHTTPPATVLQALLAEMVQRGLRWAVLEVTSHALDQRRVAGCDFDIGIFSNLTPEHLNYHGTFERYREAKARLFAMLGHEAKPSIPSFGVFNVDDPNVDALRSVCTVEQIAYGMDREADYRVLGFEPRREGTAIQLRTPHGPLELWTPLAGRFNVYNLAAGSALGLHLGLSGETIARAVSQFSGVPGRMQRLDLGQEFQVIVDFAHTPNGLRATLEALRPQTGGRLIVVFGHPGGRDLDNRRELGRVAATMADFAVLTSDDPYDEDPQAILDHVEQAVQGAGCRPGRDYVRIDDRPTAIASALRIARAEDSVLLAGRGHLDYTVVRGEKRPLSDIEVAQRELERLTSARAAS